MNGADSGLETGAEGGLAWAIVFVAVGRAGYCMGRWAAAMRLRAAHREEALRGWPSTGDATPRAAARHPWQHSCAPMGRGHCDVGEARFRWDCIDAVCRRLLDDCCFPAVVGAAVLGGEGGHAVRCGKDLGLFGDCVCFGDAGELARPEETLPEG